MTTTREPTGAAAPPATRPESAWVRVLVWISVVTAAVDLAAPGLAGAVIPPLAAGAILTVVGLLLLLRFPRTGVAVLGVTNLLLVVSSAPFAIPSLAHPDSPIGFSHAVIHLVGHPIAVVAAVAAWRRLAPAVARRTGIAAAGLLAATVLVSAAFAVLGGGDAAGAGDVTVAVRDFAFPDEVRVASGSALFVDNADPLRHTFSLEGTAVSANLPERSGVRLDIDLAPGTYQVFCDVPGHESMSGTLIVQ